MGHMRQQLLRFIVPALVVLVLSDAGSADAPKTKRGRKAARAKSKKPTGRVLVTVDGAPIAEGDLEFLMLMRRVPVALRATLRKQFLESLIDRRLLRVYLENRKVKPDKIKLDWQVARIEKMIRKAGDDPQKVLAQMGLTGDTLRDELALALRWQAYVARVITPDEVRKHFDLHRQQFDGTRVHAAQILLKVKDDKTQQQAAAKKLMQIRADILAGKLTFAEAARKFSDASSASKGGDVGAFPYRGKMPVALSRIAFSLKAGDVSEPFVTRFGVHILSVKDRKPGTLSLEDVRRQVLKQVSQQLRDTTVAELRAKARIEWTAETK